jgi:hypothetical protein
MSELINRAFKSWLFELLERASVRQLNWAAQRRFECQGRRDPFDRNGPRVAPDPERWGRLINDSLGVADYCWPTNREQMDRALELARWAEQKFLDGPDPRDLAVYEFARAMVIALRMAGPPSE